MPRVYLSLGSNMAPEVHLRRALDALADRYGPLEQSLVYRSKAAGFDGADFLNLVVGLDTDQTPAEINALIETLHAQAGRQRGSEKFASRQLDIDLLLYGDRVDASARLPRADVLEYDFVLRPLAEIAPTLRHPQTGRTMSEHWDTFDGERSDLKPVDLP